MPNTPDIELLVNTLEDFIRGGTGFRYITSEAVDDLSVNVREVEAGADRSAQEKTFREVLLKLNRTVFLTLMYAFADTLANFPIEPVNRWQSIVTEHLIGDLHKRSLGITDTGLLAATTLFLINYIDKRQFDIDLFRQSGLTPEPGHPVLLESAAYENQLSALLGNLPIEFACEVILALASNFGDTTTKEGNDRLEHLLAKLLD
jgi:hypothetical protein